MSQVINNIVTRGLSGKIGDFVFKQWGGKTIVAAAPKPYVIKSEIRKASMLNFKEAVAKAKAALTDPGVKAMYKKKAKRGQNAFNVAVSAFMRGGEEEE